MISVYLIVRLKLKLPQIFNSRNSSNNIGENFEGKERKKIQTTI